MSRVNDFVEALAAFHLPNVFNPYMDACPEHDYDGSPMIRRNNLVAALEGALQVGVETMWFGRDLGYRGGRRTGLALTDEAHLDLVRSTYQAMPVEQATTTGPVAERTAREVWRMVRQLSHPPFLWNVFPFHPHEPDDPMSNRCHTTQEARACEDIIVTLLNWIKPRKAVALGKEAQKALMRLGWTNVYVRHPRYGGQAEFISCIRALYGLSASA
jgi:uracil-DNA glycosylase